MTDFRAAWLATRIVIDVHGRTVDLDAVPAGGLLAAVFPLRPPICIVTAWNPNGEKQQLDVNRSANSRLQAELEASGQAWLRAVGESFDGTWAEPSFAIGDISESEARDIGRRWSQLAVFYVTDTEVAVLDSAGAFRDVRPRGRSGSAR